MKILSIVAALALLALLFALPTTAAPPGDSPILIIMSTQVAPDGTPMEIIRTGSMIAELNFDTNKAPALEPTYDRLQLEFARDNILQHAATAGEIILARSLKGVTVSGRPPDPMSRTV